MPDLLKRLRIFVSCPDEMSSHLPIIEAIARELSPVFEDLKGLSLKVMNWKLDIAPGVASDPQARIDEQLRYDLYIGLLGTRFGTPTANAGSGTEHEFKEAYRRYVENPSSVRLLFYFKKDVGDI